MAEENLDSSSSETQLYDLESILSSSDRNFLIRSNGEQVKIDSLKGKKVGLYFSASWCGPCQRFTPTLIDVYNELHPRGDFEVVFLSGDEDDVAFEGYFSKMPWLAIPFSDSATRDRLDELFSVNGIPHLLILDEHGQVLTENGVEIIREYGVEGYPFTTEWIKKIKEKEEVSKREQSLRTILISPSRDYVLTADGKKVPVAELEGKTVGLYFSLSSFPSCFSFTSKLSEVYEELKGKGDNFEIVMIPLDDDDDGDDIKGDGDDNKGDDETVTIKNFPWLSLPVGDKISQKLVHYFELHTLPTLVIIGPDGKTLHSNAAEAIEEHGILAYPFTPEKFAELEEIEKAKREAQTLESILVLGDRDFVIGKDGVQIPVLDLVGKNILLYFSAEWCPPCRAFLPKLVEAYHKIKDKDEAFEVIFISSDKDENAFKEFFSSMPWLAIPYGDSRKESLGKIFKVQGIPMLVAIGPTGKTVTTEARSLVMYQGAEAYPFTEARMKEIEAQYDEMAKGWPEKINHVLHKDHELVLTRRQVYNCDGCNEEGHAWSFYCDECDFDLHPKCALKDKQESKEEHTAEGKNPEDKQESKEEHAAEDKNPEDKLESKEEHAAEDNNPEDGWVCEGDVCRKA